MIDNEIMSADEIKAVERLNKDLRKAAKELGESQARYLVDAYYREQGERIAADNMVRAAKEAGEPTTVVEFIAEQHRTNEKSIKSMLNTYTSQSELGKWCKSICGIGEVITAGLMAHIDVKKAQTAGAIWRFAGLDPTQTWGKGQKRPFNADLKRLCFIIGQSFIKVQNRDKDVYGHIYAERKALEQKMNEEGMYAEQAREKLERFKIGKNTEAYKWYSKGMLPPAHINMRAARYAVKIFLSHFFEVAYEIEYNKRAPEIYAIAILQHAHKVDVPNWTHRPSKP